MFFFSLLLLSFGLGMVFIIPLYLFWCINNTLSVVVLQFTVYVIVFALNSCLLEQLKIFYFKMDIISLSFVPFLRLYFCVVHSVHLIFLPEKVFILSSSFQVYFPWLQNSELWFLRWRPHSVFWLMWFPVRSLL